MGASPCGIADVCLRVDCGGDVGCASFLGFCKAMATADDDNGSVCSLPEMDWVVSSVFSGQGVDYAVFAGAVACFVCFELGYFRGSG